jgi:hypothetical protein
VTYELEPVHSDVRLVLTHTRLDSRDVIISVCGGWHTHLEILEDVMHGKIPRPFWARHSEFEAQYEERIGKDA